MILRFDFFKELFQRRRRKSCRSKLFRRNFCWQGCFRIAAIDANSELRLCNDADDNVNLLTRISTLTFALFRFCNRPMIPSSPHHNQDHVSGQLTYITISPTTVMIMSLGKVRRQQTHITFRDEFAYFSTMKIRYSKKSTNHVFLCTMQLCP